MIKPIQVAKVEALDIETLRGILQEEGLGELANALSPDILTETAQYTIQKINAYPKRFGKTVENYFDLLYPNEIKNCIQCTLINLRTLQNRRSS